MVEKDFPRRFACDEEVCKHKVFNECMKAITSDDVWDAVKNVIEIEVVKPKKVYSV
ncbi:MAG: hypothetical protein Q7J31_04655 [Syntrophales bacterium]|nr:hypothetical protein [Syntrophales bacterium]